MYTSNVLKKLVLLAAMGSVSCGTMAVGGSEENTAVRESPASASFAAPSGTEIAFYLDNSGAITTTSASGPLIACQLCTEQLEKKYGDKCINLRPGELSPDLCAGLSDVTINDVKTITIVRSHKNPRCVTVIGGDGIPKSKC